MKSSLANEREKLDRESWRRLMPGYVRRFVEKSAPLLGLGIDGDLDGTFAFTMQKPGALDFLWNLLETYPPARRQRLTVQKPKDASEVLFLHPGEPVFDRLAGPRLRAVRRRGPRGAGSSWTRLRRARTCSTSRPFRSRARPTPLSRASPGPRSWITGWSGSGSTRTGPIESCPVEHLLLLKGGSGIPAAVESFASRASRPGRPGRRVRAEKVAGPLAEDRRRERLESLPARLEFVERGFDYQDSELAQARAKLREKAQAGDPRAKAEFTKIKDRQKALAARRENALAVLRREPELIEANEVVFLAHALVVPSDDPEDKKRFDAEVEAIAVKVAWAFEEAAGAVVKDVSKPHLARAAGLEDHPGFDLLSNRPGEGSRGIEVKGRAGIGDVELTENEWPKACNQRGRYWLYVVYDCGTPHPRLLRVQDPFGKLVVKAKGGVRIDESAIFDAAEGD